MLIEVRSLRALDDCRGAAPSDAVALVGAVAGVARLAALQGDPHLSLPACSCARRRAS